MPGEDDLLRIINAPAEVAELEKVQVKLMQMLETIKQFSGFSLVTKTTAGTAEFRSQSTLLTEAMAKMKLLEEELEKIRSTNSKNQKERTDQEIAETQRKAQATRTRVAEIRSEEDAYRKLTNEYNKAAQSAKILAAQYGVNSNEARAAARSATELSEKIQLINKAAGDSRSGVGRYTQSLKEGFRDIVSQAAQMVSAFYLVQKSFDFIKDSVKEFMSAQDSAARLRNTLNNMGRDRDLEELNKASEDLAKSLGTVATKDVQETFQKLAIYGKLSKNEMLELVPVIADFAAKQRVDMPEATSVITKALEGNVRGLKEYGINVKEGKDATERFKIIMDELAPRVHGAAKAFGDELAGSMKKTEIATEELKVKIGSEFAPVVDGLWKSILQGVEGLPQMVRSVSNAFASINEAILETWVKTKAIFGFDGDLKNLQKLQEAQKNKEQGNKTYAQAQEEAESFRKKAATETIDQQKKELEMQQALLKSDLERYNLLKASGKLHTDEGQRANDELLKSISIVNALRSQLASSSDNSPFFKRVQAAGGGVKAPSLPGNVNQSFDVQRDFNDFNVTANRESGLDQGDTSKFGAAPSAGQFSLSDAANKNIEDLAAKQAEIKKKMAAAEVELAKKTEDTIASFVKARYENELNAIQKNIDANDRAKEKETAAIQSSTLSNQEKAAAEINLNAQVEAKNEALRRKQKEVKIQEAKFDRDKAIFDIIASTAAGVMKASPVVPLMALIAATGAVELAGVIAKPIPTYRKGGIQKESGPMIVHPGELMVSPSGQLSMTPNAPETLTFGAKGTKIIPAHEVNQMNIHSMIRKLNYLETKADRSDEILNVLKEGNIIQNRALNKKTPIHIHNHFNPGFEAHIDKAVRN